MNCTAEFGEGGYRYKLGRDWSGEQYPQLPLDVVLESAGIIESRDPKQPFRYALFIMLNPSTADATRDDPTVAKCIRLARRWGFDGLQVRNIFAIRGTDPAVIKTAVDPVGPKNDAAIVEAAADPRCGLIVAAWGNHGSFGNRSQQVKKLLEELGKPVYCFRMSKHGEPEHPLYQRECGVEELVRWL